MIDHDSTFSSSLADCGHGTRALLALTLIWHPDPGRIGEQYVADAGGAGLTLSRYAPDFRRPDGAGLPLGHGAISRDCLRFTRDDADGITLVVPATRMVVQLGGHIIEGTVRLHAAQIGAGQILTLGRAIVLCLHWMPVLPRHNPVAGFVGVGKSAITVREQIRMVAPTNMPVLLLGETGTGKEVVARAIHALSDRRHAKLVTVNMAALNESLALAELFGAAKGAYTGAQAERKGLFAEADDATLFLDEIGNAPATVQPMLLRVLEGGDFRPLGATHDRHSSARLIAATDQNLDAATFNQALLRRLECFAIHLPPLRTRREDIGVLIIHLLQPQGALPKFSSQFITEMACHDWPGNIRQLAHTLKRAALQLEHGGAVQLNLLVRTPPPDSPVGNTDAGATPVPGAWQRKRPSELSEQEVLDAMTRYGWTIKAAAKALGISRPSFYKLLKENPRIRRLEDITADEIAQSIASCDGNLTRCAALLATPVEPLRRLLHRQRSSLRQNTTEPNCE